MSVNYGDVSYWNVRYMQDGEKGMNTPFDWLFSYDELKGILEYLLPNKNDEILLIGSGNAPFSPDLYFKGGYKKLINIDLSDVVVEQQAKKYPEQTWKVMDVLDMKFPSGSINYLIDKSLIDTLLCYDNSIINTAKMINEIYRVLAPGARFITFSLHSIDEIRSKYENSALFDWKVSFYWVRSNRWNATPEGCQKSVAHCMIVCDRPFENGTFRGGSEYPLPVPDVLSVEDHVILKKYADEVALKVALNQLSVDKVLECLDYSLCEYSSELQKKQEKIEKQNCVAVSEEQQVQQQQ